MLSDAIIIIIIIKLKKRKELKAEIKSLSGHIT